MIYKLFSTIFYIGFIKRGQSSIASLIGFLLFSIPIPLLIRVLIFIFVNIVAFFSVFQYTKANNLHDPKEAVADEFCAGALIALVFYDSIAFGFISLFLFRIFDLLKFWPISYFDKMRHWTGIFWDDYVGAILSVLIVFPIKVIWL